MSIAAFEKENKNIRPQLELETPTSNGILPDILLPLVKDLDPVARLDLLDRKETGTFDATVRALEDLPPDAVRETLGSKVLVWAAVNARTLSSQNEYIRYLGESGGYDTSLLNKIRLWNWQQHCSAKGQEVLSQYQVAESIIGGALEAVNLPELLEDSALPGVTLSDKRKSRYSLIPLRSEDSFSLPDGAVAEWYGEVEPGLHYHIELDAPVGFALAYKGKPQALVAVAGLDQRELMIYQLQGVQANRVTPGNSRDIVGKVSSRGLAPLDWQKLLVDVTGQLAKNLGMDFIAIQQGNQTKWANRKLRGETEPHLSAEAATKAYDDPAQRLGFIQGDDGNWHKSV